MTNRIVQLVRKLIYTIGGVGAALWSSIKLFLIRAEEGGDSWQLTCRTPMVGAALPVVLKDGSLSKCENPRAGSTKRRFRVRVNDINQLGEDGEKRIRCSRVQGSKGH